MGVCSFSDARSQSRLKAAKAGIVKDHGALCFSRSWNNILMWSHYGDRHRGICLGFDLPDNARKYWEIEYLEEILVAPDLDSLPRIEQEPFFKRLYTGKYNGWIYEEEVRAYADKREELDEETGQYFVNFDEDLKLREVIAGARFPLSKNPIDDALQGYLNVTVAKAGTSESKFELVLDKDGFTG
jgi:hypothetical protein